MTREEFIQLAGGKLESNVYYKGWKGRDKRENFWDFYDSREDEFIASIYAGIDVDELRRKQKFSIEHIIPKSFLKNYLHSKGTDKSIIKGSTTNPLNFAPCHRDLNSKRSNFPFDVDEDGVKRSFTIHLEGIYTEYGWDHEKEWVVPPKSRGDIARAVIYMCLVYGINELYGNHLTQYKKWALMDPPNYIEIKYNEWVYQRLGIQNPLINKKPSIPAAMLTDSELMDSIKLRP